MADGEAAIRVRGLRKVYGGVAAVDGIDLDVAAGEIFALLGPNGAGKTSVIMGIAGHVEVKAGDILLDGESIVGLSPSERTRRGTGLVPEGRRVFPDLTVAENLLVGGYVRPSTETATSEERVLALFPRLRERYRQRAGTLSGGEQQMLAVARALAREVKLLLLYELYEGLAPVIVRDIESVLIEVRDVGLTTIIVEQNALAALDLADRAVILDMGEVVFDGTAQDVLDDERLREEYLAI